MGTGTYLLDKEHPPLRPDFEDNIVVMNDEDHTSVEAQEKREKAKAKKAAKMPSVEEASQVFLKSKQYQLGYLIQATLRIEKGLATLTQNQDILERIIETKFYDLDLKVTEMQTTVEQLQEEAEEKKGKATTYAFERVPRAQRSAAVPVTDTRATTSAPWAATPAFRSGLPSQLASWINKGLDQGSTDEVQMLQSHIRSLVEKDTDLINVIQRDVEAILWDPNVVAGYIGGRQPQQQSSGYLGKNSTPEHNLVDYSVTEESIFDHGWMKKAERIRCSAPLPEDSADPVLIRMLAPVPYQVPAKEDKEESQKAKRSLHFEGTPDVMSGETRTPSSEDEGEEEADIPFPHGRKRTASEDLEAAAPKRGKIPLPDGSGDDVVAQLLREDKPFAKS
nr:uncharacterized protein LOC123494510 [Aegilops tauschii subsp. strangulata]